MPDAPWDSSSRKAICSCVPAINPHLTCCAALSQLRDPPPDPFRNCLSMPMPMALCAPAAGSVNRPDPDSGGCHDRVGELLAGLETASGQVRAPSHEPYLSRPLVFHARGNCALLLRCTCHYRHIP